MMNANTAIQPKISPYVAYPLILAISTLLVLIAFIVGASFFGPQIPTPAPEQGGSASFLSIVLMVLFDVSLLVLVASASAIRGWRLAFLLSAIYYCLNTLLNQLEVVFFMESLGAISRQNSLLLLTMTIPATIVVGPLIVTLMNKMVASPFHQLALPDITIDRYLWARIIGLAVLAYPFIYLFFGYFIAWKSPEVRAFYQGSDPGSFFAQLGSIVSNDSSLIPFQMFRGFIWVGLAYWIVSSLAVSPWKASIIVALCFAVIMGDGLLIQNPLMPEKVRMVHFAEILSSNFVWGMLAARVLLVKRIAVSHKLKAV